MREIVVLLNSLLLSTYLTAGETGAASNYSDLIAAELPKVSVVVRRAGELDRGLADRITVSLSSSSDIAVLERDQMERIFNEWQHGGSGVLIGKASGIDFFVLCDVDAKHETVIVEIVDAAVGRSVLFRRFGLDFYDALSGDIIAMISHMAKGLECDDVVPDNSLILTGGTIHPENSENLIRANRLLENLTYALIRERAFLLHRRHVGELTAEQWRVEKGLIASADQRKPLAGARFILDVNFSFDQTPPHLDLVLIDTHTGTRKAAGNIVLMAADTLELPDAAVKWIVARIQEYSGDSEMPEIGESDRLQPETQAPFYRGVLLFNQGMYLDAIDYFSLAHAREPEFAQPVDWISECFAAAGFDEVVSSLELYRKHVTSRRVLNVPFYHNNWRKLDSSAGVNFLGLTYRDPNLQSKGATLMNILLPLLERQGALFLPEHIEPLAREYDTFVGLASVSGVNWRSAPFLIFEHMVSAHLQEEERGVTLELVHVIGLDPATGRRATVRLAGDQHEWPLMLEKAVSAIFDNTAENNSIHLKTHLITDKSIEELEDELEREYKISTFLKLLMKTPSPTLLDGRFSVARPMKAPGFRGGWNDYAFTGLQKYTARFGVDTKKAWWEMALLTSRNPTGYFSSATGGTSRLTMPEMISRMREIAAVYPNHPAGLAARYNTLLWDLRPANYRESREELKDILDIIEAQHLEHYERLALKVMRSTFAALSLELGEPFEPLQDSYDYRGILLVITPDTFKPAGNDGAWQIFPPPTEIRESLPMPKAEGRRMAPVFLYLLPVILGDKENMPPSLDQARFVLDHAPDVRLARDIVAKKILDCMRGNMDDSEHEKFAMLCEDYARNLVNYFSGPLTDPGPFRPSTWLAPFLGGFPHFTGLSLRRMYWLPESTQERLRRVSDELESVLLGVADETSLNNGDLIRCLRQAYLLRTPEPSENELRELMEDEWDKRRVAGVHWFAYMGRKKALADHVKWLRLCNDSYERLKTIPQEQWRQKIRPYSFLGIELFKANEYELADKIHQEITSWLQFPFNSPYEQDLRPHAYWMLVLSAHRRGDIPTAFRLAQQGLKTLGDIDGQFWQEIGHASSFTRWGHSVQESLRNFMAAARADPKLPYHDPFIGYKENINETPESRSLPLVKIESHTAYSTPEPGQAWRPPGLESCFVWLEPGYFSMGSSNWRDSRPPTQVLLSHGFWMGRHEVRLGDWLRLMGTNPNRVKGNPQLPVECVSWLEAMEFCRKLTARERNAGRLPQSYVYRLPTEAEWEYAARAGSTNTLPDGVTKENIGDYAWHAGNSGGRLHPVGTRQSNAWGIFDMLGNVSEWCFDRYGRFPGGEIIDPCGPSRRDDTKIYCYGRVVRGGCADSNVRHLNCVLRRCNDLQFSADLAKYHGFRMVLGPDIVGK